MLAVPLLFLVASQNPATAFETKRSAQEENNRNTLANSERNARRLVREQQHLRFESQKESTAQSEENRQRSIELGHSVRVVERKREHDARESDLHAERLKETVNHQEQLANLRDRSPDDASPRWDR